MKKKDNSSPEKQEKYRIAWKCRAAGGVIEHGEYMDEETAIRHYREFQKSAPGFVYWLEREDEPLEKEDKPKE